MMRLTAPAAMLGALIAGVFLYVANSSPWMNAIAGRANVPAAIAHDAWPICTTMAGLGATSDWAQLDPDFAAGKRALAAEDWSSAIAALELAILRDPSNADIQNYMGFAHARLSQVGPAMGRYQRALMLDPRHRGARMHLGELFLALDEPLKAHEQLAALEEICLIPCEEAGYLARAIDAAATGDRVVAR